MSCTRHFVIAGLLIGAAGSVQADDAITLRDEVLFNWQVTGDPHGKHGLCGFVIQGNYISRANPKVVWDVNVDEIFNGPNRIVAVSAGTFDVIGKERKPRAPITEIAFGYEGSGEPVPVALVGTPNASNGVRGTIAFDRGRPLLEAFALAKWISVSLKYADGRNESLRTRGLTGGAGGGAKMNDFARCLRGDTPSSRQLDFDQATDRSRVPPH